MAGSKVRLYFFPFPFSTPFVSFPFSFRPFLNGPMVFPVGFRLRESNGEWVGVSKYSRTMMFIEQGITMACLSLWLPLKNRKDIAKQNTFTVYPSALSLSSGRPLLSRIILPGLIKPRRNGSRSTYLPGGGPVHCIELSIKPLCSAPLITTGNGQTSSLQRHQRQYQTLIPDSTDLGTLSVPRE